MDETGWDPGWATVQWVGAVGAQVPSSGHATRALPLALQPEPSLSGLSLRAPTPTAPNCTAGVWTQTAASPTPTDSCSMWRQSEPRPLDACLSLAARLL